MSVVIPLTRGDVALVDDEDAGFVLRWKWCRASAKRYAVGQVGGRQVRMHRLLLGALPGQEVDHINGDGLDNRRCNLRLATSTQNKANRRKSPGLSSRYKGVYRRPGRSTWYAVITTERRTRHLGSFGSEVEAALAYDHAALAAWGEFAFLNFPGRAAA